MTLMAIAAELNTNGVRRRGGGSWDHGFISRICRRAT
jgi:hypothetical protein